MGGDADHGGRRAKDTHVKLLILSRLDGAIFGQILDDFNGLVKLGGHDGGMKAKSEWLGVRSGASLAIAQY